MLSAAPDHHGNRKHNKQESRGDSENETEVGTDVGIIPATTRKACRFVGGNVHQRWANRWR